MSREEAMKRIETEYPEFLPDAKQILKDGGDLTELVQALDSSY